MVLINLQLPYSTKLSGLLPKNILAEKTLADWLLCTAEQLG